MAEGGMGLPDINDLIEVTLQDGQNIYKTVTTIAMYSTLSEDKEQRMAFLDTLKDSGVEPELRPGEPATDFVSITPSKPSPPRKKSCLSQQVRPTSSRGLFINENNLIDNATKRNNIQSGQSCRAQGKKGGTWQSKETEEFLRVCENYAAELRPKIPLESIWQAISDELYHTYQIDKSWQQCREKMRNLKTPWNKSKTGKYAVHLEKNFNSPISAEPDAEEEYKENTEDSQDLNDIVCDQINIDAAANFDLNMSFNALDVDGDATNIQNADSGNASEATDVENAEDTGNAPISQCVTTIKGNQWPEEAVQVFVRECVKQKAVVQVANVPNKVWKEMQVYLLDNGFSLKWEQCREKFSNMNKLFEGRLLQCNGIMSGVEWPYYQNFLEIHDVPVDFSYQVLNVHDDDDGVENDSIEMLFAKDGVTKEQHTISTKMWPEGSQKINNLVDEYAKRKQLFESTKSPIRHNTLWRDIAAEMLKLNHNVTLVQCKRKMNDLLMEFKRYYDASNRTGSGACTWGLYEKFLKMYKGNPVLKPPYSASAGSSFKYSSAKKPTTESEKSSPDSPEQQKTKKKKVPIYKSWQQEMQMKRMDNSAELVSELKLLRQGYEKRSDERLTLMREMMGLGLQRNLEAEEKLKKVEKRRMDLKGWIDESDED